MAVDTLCSEIGILELIGSKKCQVRSVLQKCAKLTIMIKNVSGGLERSTAHSCYRFGCVAASDAARSVLFCRRTVCGQDVLFCADPFRRGQSEGLLALASGAAQVQPCLRRGAASLKLARVIGCEYRAQERRLVARLRA